MKTKIICTIGPASNSEEKIKELINAGMSVARVNCSHGSIEDNEAVIELLKDVRKQTGAALSVMLDTKGPDIRIGNFEGGSVILKEGQTFTLTTRPTVGFENKVFVDYKKLPKVVKAGQILLLNDGFIQMTVVSVSDVDVICRVNTGGKLSDRKSLFVPGVDLGLPFVSRADELDLIMAVKQDVDWIAASFVSCAADVLAIKKIIKKYGTDIPIISKIESRRGVENLDEILEVTDGIMVARGDLGVEYPIEQIPILQKMIVTKSKQAGRLVVTATEMLESMIEKPRPTRAETTDVANSIYDGTSCIMLSGETAVGKNPVLAVQYMKKIAEQTEEHLASIASGSCRCCGNTDVTVNTAKDAFAKTICNASSSAKAKAICVFTRGGGTALRVAKYNPGCPVYAFAGSEKVYNQLAAVNCIKPHLCASVLTVAQMLKISNDFILENRIAKKGEIIIVNANFHDSMTDLVLIHPLG